jgi:spore coat protein U-like protein
MKQFKAKKLLVVTAALASVAALGSLSVPGTSQAATSSTPFSVTINLTSACTFTNVTTVNFAYTSSQAGVANSTGGTLDVTCPNGLVVSGIGLVASGSAAAPAASINVTDQLLNLAYTLNAPAASNGTGVAQTKTISGTMGANQPGNCAAATCDNLTSTNRTHTLVVTF